MSWIKTISYNDSDKILKRIYDRVKGPNNNIDNVLTIHSLRPHTLMGHMTLYKSVLHNANNTLPKWYLECLGVYVSQLNGCDYCVSHHFEGLKKLLEDDVRSNDFLKAVKTNEVKDFFKNHYDNGMDYARQLTLDHTNITKTTIDALKKSGYTEGEILEINQVVSYFNYVNRSVVGLGVNIEGDILGLSPNKSNDPKDWNHK